MATRRFVAPLAQRGGGRGERGACSSVETHEDPDNRASDGPPTGCRWPICPALIEIA